MRLYCHLLISLFSFPFLIPASPFPSPPPFLQPETPEVVVLDLTPEVIEVEDEEGDSD